MRQLTSQQKKALTNAITKYYNAHHKFPVEASDLPEFEDIEEMNPCEIFWQNANRFVTDYVIDKVYMQPDARFV